LAPCAQRGERGHARIHYNKYFSQFNGVFFNFYESMAPGAVVFIGAALWYNGKAPLAALFGENEREELKI